MIRFDISKYAGIALIDKFGNPLDWYEDWLNFEGQKIGEKNFRYIAKFDIHRDNKIKEVGNFVDCDPGALMCDRYSLLKLQPYIQGEVEILTMNVEGLKMSILNVINVIDCLDKNKSEIYYFESSGRIKSIKKYVFEISKIKDYCLFKIPQMARTEVFATDNFRNKVLKYELTGLEFVLAYSE